MTGLHVETHGTGRPVLLLHGAMGHGTEAWQAQLPLADRRRYDIQSLGEPFNERPGAFINGDDAETVS